jgi:hypothetical protein
LGQKIVIFQPTKSAIFFIAKELFMSNPTFFELPRVQGLPTYVNAAHVSSIDFLGTAEDGYVACLAVNTTHYLWGEAPALEAMFETTSFGNHVVFVNVVSNTPVSPKKLFDSKVCVGFANEDTFDSSFCDFNPKGADK